MYEIVRGKKEALSDIPSGVEKIDELLGTSIFPKICGVKVITRNFGY